MDFHQNLHLFYTVSFTHSQKGSKNLKLFNFWLSLFNSMPLGLKAYSIFMLLRMWWKTAAGATTLNSRTYLNHSCIVDLFFVFLQWRQKGFGRASCLTSSDVLYSDSFFFACRGLVWPQRAQGHGQIIKKPLAAFKDAFQCQMSRPPNRPMLWEMEPLPIEMLHYFCKMFSLQERPPVDWRRTCFCFWVLSKISDIFQISWSLWWI